VKRRNVEAAFMVTRASDHN